VWTCVALRLAWLCFTLCGTWAMLLRGRETASGRMEKSAVLAPVPKQKVSIVEREGLGWTVWLDSQCDGDCPICGKGPNSRHGSYVPPIRDLPAQGTSVLIQATRRVADSSRAPRFTCHKMGCGATGVPMRASARVPHRVKQSRVKRLLLNLRASRWVTLGSNHCKCLLNQELLAASMTTAQRRSPKTK
jgi:hypothetical protein